MRGFLRERRRGAVHAFGAGEPCLGERPAEPVRQDGLRFVVRQRADRQGPTPVPEGGVAGIKRVHEAGRSGKHDSDGTRPAGVLHGPRQVTEYLRIGLMRLVQGQ